MGVVLISTIFFSTFGIENWKILARIWAVIPVLNGIVFLTSPIYSLHEEGEKGLSIKGLCSMKIFWVVMLMMTCAVCGFSVGIMWPGTISITSGKIPLGGTAMFALLAMAGDLGGSIGPGVIGVVTQNANDNLKAGMLAACVFPVVLILSVLFIRKKRAEIKPINQKTESFL